MKLLDRYTQELAGPFFFGVGAFTSIFIANQLFLKLTGYLAEGAPLGDVAALIAPPLGHRRLRGSASVGMGLGVLTAGSKRQAPSPTFQPGAWRLAPGAGCQLSYVLRGAAFHG